MKCFGHNILRLIMATLLIFMGKLMYAQNTPEVNAEREFCYDPESPIAIGDFVTLGGDDNGALQGMQITISQGYDPNADMLTYQDNNGVSGSFDAANGVLTLTGNTSLLVYKDVIQQVFFSTTAREEAAIRSISVSLSSLDFLPETGHFYQYVEAPGILWNPAKDAAAGQSLFGLTGYLATITSKAESDFLIERVSGSAWIGATDEANEGTWRWVTGPEGLENGGAGRIVSGFINWNDGEPNNCCGGEDFAHMMDWTSPPGRWNDLNNNSAPPGSPYHPTGYMIEYGGMPGEPNVVANITGTTVLDPLRTVTLTGPASVCPNLTGVTYTATDLPGYSYVWTVQGGDIASGQGNHEVTVDWLGTNANASVSVKAVSDIACEIDADYPVTINVQLEPPIPTGPDVVCFTNLGDIQVYNTPETPGSIYLWQITNGEILSGDSTNQVEVLWDGPGTGELYFTERTTTSTDICDGDSPVLEVDLREEIIPTISITNVSCYEGRDGIVQLSNIQAREPVSLTWKTNGLGLPITDGITDLPAGTYSVDVDSDGCVINVIFTITEPDELQGSVQATDALCKGQASGTAVAAVTGGTGVYTYNWSINRPNQSAIDRLPKGSYTVAVIDENQCVLVLDFIIDEPDELVIDSIASTLVTCPEGSDGTLQAFVSGGTEPYSYSWENSNEVTALAGGFPKGTYRLTVTDANGCIASETQVVEEATPKVFLPTAFSPNGDDENETFGPTTTCPFDFRMTVYNRWGNPIFATNSTSNRWDGTIEGEQAPPGNYTYTAAWSIVVNDQLIAEERKGSVRLFR